MYRRYLVLGSTPKVRSSRIGLILVPPPLTLAQSYRIRSLQLLCEKPGFRDLSVERESRKGRKTRERLETRESNEWVESSYRKSWGSSPRDVQV